MLQRENAAQRAQLAEQAATNAAQLDRLIAINAELTREVARLNERVGELLAVAQRRQRPAAPPATPPPAPAVDAATARAFADRPAPPPVPPKVKPQSS